MKMILRMIVGIQLLALATTPAFSLAKPESNLKSLRDGWTIEALISERQGAMYQLKETRQLDQAIDKIVSLPLSPDQKYSVRYQTTLQTKDNQGHLQLWLPNPLGSLKVWANDQLVYDDGIVLPDGSELRRGDAFIDLPVADQIKLTILVDNSGYQLRGTGFYKIPLLGHSQEIQDAHRSDTNYDMLIIGLLGIASLYHFFLFLLRTKDRSPLIFAGFIFFVALRQSLAGDGRLLLNGDVLSPIFSYGLEVFATCMVGALFAIFPAYILKPERLFFLRFGPRLLWIPFGLAATGAALSLVPVPAVIEAGLSCLHLMVLSILLLMFPWLLLATWHRQPQSGLILIGYLSPIIGSLMDILSFLLGGWNLVSLGSLGMSVFVCAQAMMLSIRFNHLFDEVDELNEGLEQKVAEQTRDIRSTLDNIPQGVFRIVGDVEALKIDEEYSAGLELIIGTKHIAAQDPFAVIFDRSDIPVSDRANLRSCLGSSLGEDILQFEGNQHLLPHECHIEQKTIEIDWSPVLNESDEVEKILCVLKDVTKERELQDQLMREAESALLMKEIARVQSYEKVDGFLQNAHDYLAQAQEDLTDQVVVYRSLHTLKGLAMIYGFKRIANQAHEAESDVKRLLHQLHKEEAQQELKTSIEKISDSLAIYRETLDQLYGHSHDTVSVRRDDLENVEFMLMNGRTDHALRKLLFMHEHNVARALADEIDSARSLARRLGKEEPEVKFENDDYILDNHLVGVLKKSFVHMLRNSIDHGLESAEERLAKGKAAAGTLRFAITQQKDRLKIRFCDDGQGLNIRMLRRKAEDLGYGTDLTEEALAQMIFLSGLSTAKAVTQISGRGVGMEAVQKFIEAEGGRVTIELDKAFSNQGRSHVPFAFVIDLPFQGKNFAAAS